MRQFLLLTASMAYLISDLEALFQCKNYYKAVSEYVKQNGVEDLLDYIELGLSTRKNLAEFALILKVLSMGCNDPEIRKLVNIDLVKKCILLEDDQVKLYSYLALIKIGKLADITFDMSLIELLERALADENQSHDAVLEILVYISTIGTLKELIISDFIIMDKLKSMIKIPTCQYAVATTISHLAAFPKILSQEQQQVLEIQRMAKAAPPQDEYDLREHVEKRVELLIEYGLIQEFSKLKIDRVNTLISIAEIVNATASVTKYRGMLAQWGFPKLLISLCYAIISNPELDLNQDQKIVPGHALAKILISTNPELSLRGNLAIDAGRPLLFTINNSNSTLIQFECLLALTNLAGMNDEVRGRLLNLNILNLCEEWQFDNHPMIRRASTELLCNLIVHPSLFVKFMDPKYNGIQIMTALCDDEDVETQRAASGAIAMLSSEPATIALITKQSRFFEIMKNLIISKNDDLIHRGSEILKNVGICKVIIPDDLLLVCKEFSNHPNSAISANFKLMQRL